MRGASQDPVFVVFFGARSGSECAWVAEWQAFDVASVDALGNPRLKRRQQKPFQEALEQACSHVGLVLEAEGAHADSPPLPPLPTGTEARHAHADEARAQSAEGEILYDLEPSHVVWAKLAGCPWWPAYKSEPATAAQRDMR